jgi:hypothetical protein
MLKIRWTALGQLYYKEFLLMDEEVALMVCEPETLRVCEPKETS